MAHAHSNGPLPLPEGLLEALAVKPVPAVCRDRVEAARQHARRRAFDEPVVVREIATQLLALSHT